MATDRNDALLAQILAGQAEMLGVLGEIRDRLPVPDPAGAGGQPVTAPDPEEPDVPPEQPDGDEAARKPPAKRVSEPGTPADAPTVKTTREPAKAAPVKAAKKAAPRKTTRRRPKGDTGGGGGGD